MLFHVGSLWRLHEAGILGRLDRISSVSGGSITSGALALAWEELRGAGFTHPSFDQRVVAPLRELAGKTIDARSGLHGHCNDASRS